MAIYPNSEDAQTDIFDYIELFDNRKRRYSRVDHLSPAEYKAKSRAFFPCIEVEFEMKPESVYTASGHYFNEAL